MYHCDRIVPIVLDRKMKSVQLIVLASVGLLLALHYNKVQGSPTGEDRTLHSLVACVLNITYLMSKLTLYIPRLSQFFNVAR